MVEFIDTSSKQEQKKDPGATAAAVISHDGYHIISQGAEGVKDAYLSLLILAYLFGRSIRTKVYRQRKVSEKIQSTSPR